MAFVKLDTGILNSTLWYERDPRVVFITALLMATPWELLEPIPQIEVRSLKETGFIVPPGWYGFVAAAGVGIVRTAMVDHEAGLDALEKLGAPDPESRSPAHDGRRLVRVAGGYIVLNFIEYRDRDSTTAERSRRWRERQKQRKGVTVTEGNGVADTATRVSKTPSRVIRHQAEAEAEADKKISPPTGAHPLKGDADVNQAFRLFNDACQRTGWPKAQRISDDRKKKMLGRIKDAGGIDGIAVAIGKAEASQFLTETWKGFSIDWLLKPANFTKLMEGNYDGKPTNGNRGVGSAETRSFRPSGGDDAFYDQLAVIARRERDGGRDGS